MKIVVAATFTAEPLQDSLRFWIEELEISAKIVFAPGGQLFQQLVDPSSELARNRGGFNVLLVRMEDLGAGGTGAIERSVAELRGALEGALRRAPTPYVVCLCPSPHESAVLRGFERPLAASLREVPGVQAVTVEELLSTYPVGRIYDEHGDRLANIPYTPELYAALGTMIARRIYALGQSPYKVVAVDADQTLWTGVCGEDGPLGVTIDRPRLAIQEFLEKQRKAGMLLCLCSKNNEEDVAAVFERRPEMVLRRDDFAGWRVNWISKSENLRSLARELRLGLESFIFLDDDPVARADVQANCPEVLTLPLPENPESIGPFLERIWAFDHFGATKEGADRTGLYRQESERREFQLESPTLREFLSGLALQIHIAPAAPHDLARVAELTLRTNQFNATTVWRSEAALHSLLTPGGPECLVVRVRDRFGDYGLVGVMIVQAGADVLEADTFLLSCRALARGVEHRMLARLGEIASQKGLSTVRIPFVPSGKNRPALDFLESVGADLRRDAGAGLQFDFPAARAAAARYDPPAGPAIGSESSADAPDPAAARPSDAGARAAVLASIANELSSVEQIVGLLAAKPRSRPDSPTPWVAPSSAAEKRIAAMFTELLGVENVGLNDSFFDLGGHSLLAFRLINRLRDEFELEFPVTALFEEDFTVGKAARMLHQFQGTATAGSLARLVENMSDDEVLSLLAAEKGLAPGKGGGEKA